MQESGARSQLERGTSSLKKKTISHRRTQTDTDMKRVS
jgi:hypothetical protein